MATENYADVTSATKRNIVIGIVDKGLSRTATANLAGIPTSTFHRKLDNPEQFTLKDLGSIAQALDIELTDLFKDAA